MSGGPGSDPVASGWRGRVLDVVAGLVLLYLFIPIFVIVLYSFNRPAGRYNFVWKAFSLDAWRDPFKYQPLVDSMKLSLQIAAISTSVAIVFGALIAIASCHFGLSTKGGAPGVGRSVNATVVASAAGIFVLDYLVSFILG